MLRVTIDPVEQWDELNNEFVTFEGRTLTLEHSLVSLSKWESKWNKPFLTKDEKTLEETLDYIRCMTLDKNVDESVYSFLSEQNIKEINEYIAAPMTATTFYNNKKGGSREIVTSEVIYYWMISLNIPFECQKWHLNRLITLIKVCEIKSSPAKKMSRSEIMSRNAALNEARRKKFNSAG